MAQRLYIFLGYIFLAGDSCLCENPLVPAPEEAPSALWDDEKGEKEEEVARLPVD